MTNHSTFKGNTDTTNSLDITKLFYANFTNTQFEKVPSPHLPRTLKLVLSEKMRSGEF